MAYSRVNNNGGGGTNNNNNNNSQKGGGGLIANLLVPFCESASISLKGDCSAALRKRIIVSLPFVDSKALHDALFPRQYMHWENVQEYLQQVVFTTSDWIKLVSIIDFKDEQNPRPHAADIISSALAGVHMSTQGRSLNPLESLQLCFAKAGISPSWDILCKTMVLCNLSDVDYTSALQHLLSNTPALADSTVSDIVRFLPSACKHIPQEYLAVFSQILGHGGCDVRAHIIAQSVKARDDAIEKLKADSNAVFLQSRKPSISRVLETVPRGGGGGGNNNNNIMMVDTFAAFSDASRMAANASMRIKHIAYYIVCLPLVETSTAKQNLLQTLVGNDEIVTSALMNISIGSPDINIIKLFLLETQHSGAPCQFLRQFRENCIPGGTRGMNWTTVLRLYLSAYCKPSISKDLWSHALFIAGGQAATNMCNSAETDTAVQNWVRQNPLKLDEILPLLLDN